MSYISQRTVKGKKYYYLEESFFFKKILVKESVYFGSMYPSNDELFLGFEVLKRTCLARNHLVLVPPLTEFIKNRTGKKLFDLIEFQKNNDKLQIQNHTFKKKEKINALKEIIQKNNFNIPSVSLNNCMNYYLKILKKNESLNETKLKKIYCLLNGLKEISFSDEESKLIHLLIVWLNEKNDLIHPIEFASKFSAKLYSLNLFKNQNLLFIIIINNYLLEQKGFFPITPSQKRMPSFINSLNEGLNENYKKITVFFVKETLKKLNSNNKSNIYN